MQVKENRNKQYSKEVEDATYKMLAERHEMMVGVKRKRSRKHRRHVLSEDEEEDHEEEDSIFPEDELVLLAREQA
jgi:hypothetical protein